ncbi:hypothetical protein [Frankia sp. Cas4]|uniref:hypothetical protein n=1 Tax=Frankia sp. Cas4 TaxID=3073927 RepID=UPI002AD1E3EC|nr:hypothetical protein [Frankia sp. Cas4]
MASGPQAGPLTGVHGAPGEPADSPLPDDALGRAGAPASWDPGRHRFRLTPRHLAVLGQLIHPGMVENELQPDLAALAAAGIVDDGLVVPAAAELVRAWAAPDLLVHVETNAPTGILSHGVAIRGRIAWTVEAWPGSDIVEHAPLEPALLVPAMARMVDLRLPPVAVSGGEAVRCVVSVPMAFVDRAFTAVDAVGVADRSEAITIIREVGRRYQPPIREADITQLAVVLSGYKLSWRVTVSWDGGPVAPPAAPGDVQLRSLVVIDAGPAGFWRRETPAEPLRAEDIDSQMAVRLVPVSAKEVWAGLVELLPESAGVV